MLRFLALGVTWLVWSGHYSFDEPLIAGFGVISCVFVLWLAERMQRVSAHESEATLGPNMVTYLPWLIWEIVKANLAVAKLVISPAPAIRRQIVRVPAGQLGEGARVLHANSITLTPGTISLAVHDDEIVVHAIDDAAAQGVLEGEMNRRVGALENRPPEEGTKEAGT